MARRASLLDARRRLRGVCGISGVCRCHDVCFAEEFVCHAYVDDPIVFKRQTGLNFPSHTDGVVLYERLLSLLEAKKIRTVIGQ